MAVDEFVEAVQQVFPRCCIHVEDWTGVDAVLEVRRWTGLPLASTWTEDYKNSEPPPRPALVPMRNPVLRPSQAPMVR
jgi:hypothetical protein